MINGNCEEADAYRNTHLVLRRGYNDFIHAHDVTRQVFYLFPDDKTDKYQYTKPISINVDNINF